MDTPVGNELMEREARNFPTDGVESGEDYSLRCVVNNDFYSCSSFEGADVSAFTTDDASFDFVRVNLENGNGVFDCGFCSHSLDALHNDSLSLFVCRHLGFVHDIVDIACCRCLCFILE